MAVDLSRRLAQTVERELPNLRALAMSKRRLRVRRENGRQRKNWGI